MSADQPADPTTDPVATGVDQRLLAAVERAATARAVSARLTAATEQVRTIEALVARRRERAAAEQTDVTDLERGLPGLVAFVKGERDERLVVEQAEAADAADAVREAVGRLEDAQVVADRLRTEHRALAGAEQELQAATSAKLAYLERIGDWRVGQLHGLALRAGGLEGRLNAGRRIRRLASEIADPLHEAPGLLSDARRELTSDDVGYQQRSALAALAHRSLRRVEAALDDIATALRTLQPSTGLPDRLGTLPPPAASVTDLFLKIRALEDLGTWTVRATTWRDEALEAVEAEMPNLQAQLTECEAVRMDLLQRPTGTAQNA